MNAFGAVLHSASPSGKHQHPYRIASSMKRLFDMYACATNAENARLSVHNQQWKNKMRSGGGCRPYRPLDFLHQLIKGFGLAYEREGLPNGHFIVHEKNMWAHHAFLS